jgi:hypothetical protein
MFCGNGGRFWQHNVHAARLISAERDGHIGLQCSVNSGVMLTTLRSLPSALCPLPTDDFSPSRCERHKRFSRYVDAAIFGCICGNCATFRTDRSCTTGNRDLLSIEDQSRTWGPYFISPIVRSNLNRDFGVNFNDCPSQAFSPDIQRL